MYTATQYDPAQPAGSIFVGDVGFKAVNINRVLFHRVPSLDKKPPAAPNFWENRILFLEGILLRQGFSV